MAGGEGSGDVHGLLWSVAELGQAGAMAGGPRKSGHVLRIRNEPNTGHARRRGYCHEDLRR